ncbi:MAG: phage major capsid protein [Rhodopseudomonas palustris]|nr:phage major capsid protein [Rhodopseudomonas palustris]
MRQGSRAVKDLLKSETEAIMSYIPHKLNKQFWGDGSGRLAILSAAVAGSVTGYVDGDTTNWGLFGIDSNGYTAPSKYLFEGMSVDIYSSAGVLEASDVKINTISEGGAGTDTLTFASAVTASDNSFIFDHDTYAAAEAAGTGVPMGLIGMIASGNPYIGITASSAFQGINRSTYSWAQAQVFNMGSAIGSPAVVTEKKPLEVIQKCERYGTLSTVITNDEIWRALFEILKADKTMPNDPGYWGGLTGIKFYGGKAKGLPIIYDEDCPDGRIYFIDDKTVKVSAPDKNGMDWLPGDSGNILTRVQGKDEYAANLRWYYNMTLNKPKANGLLRYVKHASA